MIELTDSEIDTVSGAGLVDIFRGLLYSAYRSPGVNAGNLAVFYYEQVTSYANATFEGLQDAYNNFTSEADSWYRANYTPWVSNP